GRRLINPGDAEVGAPRARGIAAEGDDVADREVRAFGELPRNENRRPFETGRRRLRMRGQDDRGQNEEADDDKGWGRSRPGTTRRSSAATAGALHYGSGVKSRSRFTVAASSFCSVATSRSTIWSKSRRLMMPLWECV